MSPRLYDTASRQVKDLTPLRPGRVGLYVCGATVQSAPHLGHLRAAAAFDVLVRWLTASGLGVTYVRNVTDVDDKILAKAAEAGRPWWAHAARYEREFTAAYDALGMRRPDYEPRATGHVTEMVDLIARLIEAGHAYPGTRPGDVWFDVRSWPAYGELTRQPLGELPPADDDGAAEDVGKRDPRDFALWKGVPASDGDARDEASWPTPWGRGRPGWHLECSAMSTRYLGAEFDLHGGGLDLRFPHHENEVAQSRAAGDGFAQHWLHSSWVTLAGEKMSKSVGNVLGVDALLTEHRPVVVRYWLIAAHYRSLLEWSPDSLAEAAAAYDRIEGFLARVVDRAGALPDSAATDSAQADLPAAFVAAMDDDLGVPQALAVVHGLVRDGNTALAAGDLAAATTAARAVRAAAAVLGIDPTDPHWGATGGTDDRAHAALDTLIRAALAERAQARADRDFAAADAVRDRLTEAGVSVEDTPDGARWTLTDQGER